MEIRRPDHDSRTSRASRSRGRSSPASSGTAAPATDQLCVNDRGGYFYLYTNQYLWPKTDSGGVALVRHYVARCPIADKMAPGKWWKFYEGAWNQPAIGGRASYVDACCVTYNSYLKKYLLHQLYERNRLLQRSCPAGLESFLSPGIDWGTDGVWGFWAANAEKNDVYHCGQTLLVYGFWQKIAGRRFRLELDTNGSPDALLGVNSASVPKRLELPVVHGPETLLRLRPVVRVLRPCPSQADAAARLGQPGGEILRDSGRTPVGRAGREHGADFPGQRHLLAGGEGAR